MIKYSVFRHTILFCFLLLLPLPALAISTISINSTGNDAFIFSGTSLENVSRIEVVAYYDTSLLANPRVNPQNSFDGASVIVNGWSAGSVRMTVISSKAMNGNGTFATLSFDNIGKGAGVITSLTGNIYGANGARLQGAFIVTNPPAVLDPNDPDDASMLPGGKFYVPGGGEYMGEERPESEKAQTESGETQSASLQNAATPAADSSVSAQPEQSTKRITRQTQSVLERFRMFEGERTPKNLIALFDLKEKNGFKQAPPVFLADGESTLKVTISNLQGKKAPSIALSSARFVAQHKVSDTEWEIEAMPERGVTSSEMTVLTDTCVLEVPFTVAPKARVDLIKHGKVSEKDFALFLKKRGTKTAPKFDLNGDGKRDYLDDYIFTANYLVALENEKTGTLGVTSSQKGQKIRNRKIETVKKSSVTRTAKITGKKRTPEADKPSQKGKTKVNTTRTKSDSTD
jgi:hypothetical protein